MTRRSLWTATFAPLLLLLMWPAGAEAKHRCQIKGSKTVVATKTTRIFTVDPELGEPLAADYYGCRYRVNRPFPLVPLDFDGDIYDLRVAGPYVAFHADHYGGESSSSEIWVRDLRNGRRRLSRSAASAPPVPGTPIASPPVTGEGYLYKFVLRRTGAVAWVGRAHDYPLALGHHPPGCVQDPPPSKLCHYPFQVYKADAKGVVLLDEGHDILAKSLRLKGSTIHWTKGGQTYSAPLR